MDSAVIAEMVAARLLGVPLSAEDLREYLTARHAGVTLNKPPLDTPITGWRVFDKSNPVEAAIKHSIPWVEFSGLVWIRVDALAKLKENYPIWFERLRQSEIHHNPLYKLMRYENHP